MSGKRVNSGKKTGSQSVSEKSLKNGHHDTEEEPETQPVQQKQITFQLGVEGNIENPILVPKVTYKKKQPSKLANHEQKTRESISQTDTNSFIETRKLTGVVHQEVRFKDEISNEDGSLCKCEDKEELHNGSLPTVSEKGR